MAAALIIGVPQASAQRADPVAALARALSVPTDPTSNQEMQARQKELIARIDALRTVSQMRAALNLPDWRDQDADPASSKVDIAARQHLVERLKSLLERALRSKDVAQQLAALTVIGEMASTARGVGSERSLADMFTPDLVRLVESDDPILREPAAIALSKASGDPVIAARILSRLFDSPDVGPRRVAARGLENMVQQVAELSRGSNTSTVRAGIGDVVNVGRAVLAVIGPGLRDPDVDVRRRCLNTILSAAGTFSLADVLTGAAAAEGTEPRGGPGVNVFQPLAQSLAQVTPEVTERLLDPEPSIRLLAAQVLDQIAYARVRILRRPAGLPATPGPAGPEVSAGGAHLILVAQMQGQRRRPPRTTPPPELPPEAAGEGRPPDPIGRALYDSLPILERAMHDPDRRVRQTVIDTLEMLQRAATPAIPQMARLLYDRDKFIRWQTARTLGKLNPAKAAPEALPGLVRLLGDNDVDVRMAASVALERFGPEAAPAVAALARAATRGDAEACIAAVHALEAIGSAAVAAVPSLTGLLSNDDNRVRQVAAEALGRLGPAASSALPALQRALSDPDPDVRRAAGDAILDIENPAEK
jgi:HEAT repeat protein